MNRKAFLAPLALTVAMSVGAEENDHLSDHAKEMMQEGNSDYTLIQIMHDLALQVNRIEFGILTNNRYMIEQGAKAITTHPSPAGGIKPYLRKNADSIKKQIPVMDKNIHQTAEKIASAAKSASMAELQDMNNKIMTNCVACHNLFRD
jgi:hypothetical protein